MDCAIEASGVCADGNEQVSRIADQGQTVGPDGE